jgi:hypothetical protein
VCWKSNDQPEPGSISNARMETFMHRGSSHRIMNHPQSSPLGVSHWTAALFLVISPAILAAPAPQAQAAPDTARRPVLVELFTSEGCSSCPPVDALIDKLDADQFVPGAQAIVLSEHVTYWNQQGWEDPFSLDSLTQRQNEYKFRFNLDSVYTPQIVINGEAQMDGSNVNALGRAIAQAAAASAPELAIDEAEQSGSTVRFKVLVSQGSAAQAPAPGNARLMAALADDSAQSSVRGGENSGRTLRYVAVVRVLNDMGKGAFDGRELSLKIPSGGPPAPASPLRLVVFLADRHSGHVLAVTERTLSH